MATPQPLLLVVSGPSGSGKGTLCDMLRKELSNLVYSISLTTRAPRNGETDGVEYFFVSRQAFEQHLQAEDFMEWASVYENYYGSLRQPVVAALQAGHDVLMELDVQGAQKVKKAFPAAVLVFIRPPSLDELDARITRRGKDSPETIRKRMEAAPQELEAAECYDYILVNDRCDRALAELLQAVRNDRGN